MVWRCSIIKVVDQYKGRGYSDIFEIHTLGLVFGFGIFICFSLLFKGGQKFEFIFWGMGICVDIFGSQFMDGTICCFGNHF